MFAAMMDAIKEESVGFLFNLEVQVEAEEAAPPPPAEAVGAQPQLDLSLLKAAQEEHEHEHPVEGRPQIKAKGLDREPAAKPMIYSAPELGSETPAVKTTSSGDGAKPAGQSSTARRQQARQNPNRGSRGNKSKRKR
jgi:preprotein translocase subunit SecA